MTPARPCNWFGLVVLLVVVDVLFCAGCVINTEPGWLGLNMHLGYPDDEGNWAPAEHGAARRRICNDLVVELGVPSVRDLIMSWARVQPGRDAPYDFSLSDDLVRWAQTADVDLLALCAGVPRWAAGGPGTGPVDFGVPSRQYADEFAAFVRAFIERYDGDGWGDMRGLHRPVRAYEFMNEMENVPTNEYAYWLKLFHESATEACPKVTVALGSLRSPGVQLTEQSAGDYPTYFERLLSEPTLSEPADPFFDAVSFHCYPARYPGRSAFDDPLVYLRQTMAKRGLDRPIWLTAYGCRAKRAGPAKQAEDIVKWAIRAKALEVDRVYLQCLADGRWSGDADTGDGMGLVGEVTDENVPAKRPALRAFQTLLREVKERPSVNRRDEGVYRLTGQGDPVYAIWRVDSYDPSPLLISGWWEVRKLSGSKSTQQGANIEVTSRPLFLEKTSSAFLD